MLAKMNVLRTGFQKGLTVSGIVWSDSGCSISGLVSDILKALSSGPFGERFKENWMFLMCNRWWKCEKKACQWCQYQNGGRNIERIQGSRQSLRTGCQPTATAQLYMYVLKYLGTEWYVCSYPIMVSELVKNFKFPYLCKAKFQSMLALFTSGSGQWHQLIQSQ